MRKIFPLIVVSVLLLFPSCLFVGTFDDESDLYGETYVEVISDEEEWLTGDLTRVYVNLYANMTTGYGWQYSIAGESIRCLSEDYIAPPYSDMVGVGGEWTATFGLTGADGVSIVTLRYMRDFGNKDVAETRLFSVTVEYGMITDVTDITAYILSM